MIITNVTSIVFRKDVKKEFQTKATQEAAIYQNGNSTKTRIFAYSIIASSPWLRTVLGT